MPIIYIARKMLVIPVKIYIISFIESADIGTKCV